MQITRSANGIRENPASEIGNKLNAVAEYEGARRDPNTPCSPRSTITSTKWRRSHQMRKSAAAAAAVVAAGAAFAAAALWYRRSSRRWRRAELIMRELKERCETPVERLWAVADAMADEMRAGIASEGRSSLRMIADPSISLPTG